jgi:hypothetical protein
MTGQQRTYPQRYFELQLLFSDRVAAALGQPYSETLLTHTSLYQLLALDGDFDAAHPVWQEVVARACAENSAHQIYRLYLSRLNVIPTFAEERHWGCFAYEYRPSYNGQRDVIRLHFDNQDTSSLGPLCGERMAARQAELTAMVRYIAAHEPHATAVCGGSWLYNRASYRRLFPPAFSASAVVDEPHYQYRALWGQFLQHDWTVNEGLATRFLDQVVAARSAHEFAACFPYQVLLTTCGIADFLTFYGVSRPVGQEQ